MMFNSARYFVLVSVFVFVCISTIGLIRSGIKLSTQQKRVDELAEILSAEQSKMRELYNRRASLIQAWFERRNTKAASPPEAEMIATTEGPAPNLEETASRDVGEAAITAVIKESRRINLITQADFGRFDHLQNEISQYIAATLLEALRSEVAQTKETVIIESIKEFETLEADIAISRKSYDRAALERNKLVASLNNLPFGLGRRPTPEPLFAADASLAR